MGFIFKQLLNDMCNWNIHPLTAFISKNSSSSQNVTMLVIHIVHITAQSPQLYVEVMFLSYKALKNNYAYNIEFKYFFL